MPSFLTTIILSLISAYQEEKFSLDLMKLNIKESYESRVH
jgi:hypothetical protein